MKIKILIIHLTTRDPTKISDNTDVFMFPVHILKRLLSAKKAYAFWQDTAG